MLGARSVVIGILASAATLAETAGPFTREQAAAGESLYQVHCASCHLGHLGGRNEAPQLAGGNFMKTWTRRTSGDLFVYMQGTMPPSNRGGLGEDAYVNLTAFILEANGAVAGWQPMQASMRVAIGSVANGQMTPELRTKLNAAATSNQAGLFMIPRPAPKG